MNYSIIITFYQNVTMLMNCICALTDTLRAHKDVEIVLVNDNPSVDLSTTFTKDSIPVPFTLLQGAQNLGHSGACNVGVKHCSGKFLVFLDCDIIVSYGWLESLQKTFFSHADCGAAMSTILDFSNNQVVYAGMELYKAESIKPFQGSHQQHPFLLKDHATQIVTAGCMMVRRTTYELARGLDETFFNSCNDLDFSMRLNAMKHQNYVSAHSIVYHRGNVSGEIRFASHTYARSYFFQKWRDEIEIDSHALAILDSLYAQQEVPCGDYLVIDFSSSLFSQDYIKCLCNAKNISPINQYRIRCSQPKIIIMDYLQWDISQLNTPVLYFTDDYRYLLNNYLWFQLRAGKKDIIADWNGNIINCPWNAETFSENIAESR